MTRLEMVEQIREKTGVTYDVAKETLEKSDWDMLDAIIALEKPDFTMARQMSTANTDERKVVRRSATAGEVGAKITSVIKFILKAMSKGETMRMEIYRKDEPIETISITALILLVLINWWIPAVLIVAGLFTGFKYKFTGTGKLVNIIAAKTGEKAEEIKAKINEE